MPSPTRAPMAAKRAKIAFHLVDLRGLASNLFEVSYLVTYCRPLRVTCQVLYSGYMPSKTAGHGASQDHHHEMSLDDTYNFLNTIELESGALVDRFATFDDAAAWLVDRGVCHENLEPAALAAFGRDRGRALARVRSVRGALREVAHAVAEDRLRRTLRSRRSTGRSGRESGSSWCGPRRCISRPQPCRRPARRRARAPGRPAGQGDPVGPLRARPRLRQRHVPLDLLRRVAVAASAAGATWRAAATGPRRPATGRGRRRPLAGEPGGRYVAGTRSNSGRTSVVSRVIDSSSCGDGKPAMRCR